MQPAHVDFNRREFECHVRRRHLYGRGREHRVGVEKDRVDRQLVEQAQMGDKDAYDAIARAVAPRLYRVAHRIVRDLDAAQDATQQALVAIWRELPRLRDPDRFDAWAYQLAVRYCLMELRSQRRRLAVPVAVTAAEADAREPSRADHSRVVADRDELERAFRLLTEDQRAVVVLRHYVGLSVAEAAQILGVPTGTAASRLHYATQALRAALEANDRLAVIGAPIA